ncbi:hypothetical protein T4D_15102 [Trichinella pseudospiralis]|uniref:Uncharacterized protein n=1 Tax=Trichinella pseudospiralis TaxID=6337 RepID=A0A0V1FA95_TRIPS|nr:hypothetical protein T4D_15102 [Trichinella pseudospiralis]
MLNETNLPVPICERYSQLNLMQGFYRLDARQRTKLLNFPLMCKVECMLSRTINNRYQQITTNFKVNEVHGKIFNY